MGWLPLSFATLLVAATTTAATAPALPTLAICVAIKDQAADVREWIVYHNALGQCRHVAVWAVWRRRSGVGMPTRAWPLRGVAGGCRPAHRSPTAELPRPAIPPGVSKFYIWDTGSNPPLLVSIGFQLCCRAAAARVTARCQTHFAGGD